MKLRLIKTAKELEDVFKVTFLQEGIWQRKEGLINTGDQYPVITNERPVKLQSIQWGFPLYLDDSRKLLRLISQVGIESVLDKPMFANITSNRCLVPLQLGDESTIKYGAGIWDIFTNSEGRYKCFSLLTKQSKEVITRTPYLLTKETYRKWLSEKEFSSEELESLFSVAT